MKTIIITKETKDLRPRKEQFKLKKNLKIQCTNEVANLFIKEKVAEEVQVTKKIYEKPSNAKEAGSWTEEQKH